MRKLLRSFARNESGATAIEYGIIAALMGAGLIASVPTLTTAIQTKFTSIASTLNGK